jgi:hypothetical protein
VDSAEDAVFGVFAADVSGVGGVEGGCSIARRVRGQRFDLLHIIHVRERKVWSGRGSKKKGKERKRAKFVPIWLKAST